MNTATRVETIERTERPWGWYETISEATGNKVKRIRVHAGQQLSLQKHHRRAEHWVVVLGTAHVTVGERVQEPGIGAHVDIAIGAVHRLANRPGAPVELGRGVDLVEPGAVRNPYVLASVNRDREIVFAA